MSDLLNRKRVLLAEDNILVALGLQACAHDVGLETLGPVRSAQAARNVLFEERPDYVLLDYRLADGAAEGLAEILRAEGIPFAWMTGCSRWEIPPGPEPILQKPWEPAALRKLFTSIS